MSENEDPQDIVSYWPSVSDLFMTMFIIGLAMLGALYYVLTPKLTPTAEKGVVEAVGFDMRHVREPVNRMREALGDLPPLRQTQSPKEVIAGLAETADEVVSRLASLTKEIDNLRAESDKPIIRIDGATKEYRFDSGSAVMSEEFKRGLYQREFQTLAQEILRRNTTEHFRIDTIELIGHTDGEPVAKKGKKAKKGEKEEREIIGNLDEALPAYLSGQDASVEKLHPGSNNDLGLLRALAVRDAWNDFVRQHRFGKQLGKMNVRCYSAGQTIPEAGVTTDPQTFRRTEERFRRIEVRLTKLGSR